MNIVVFSQTNHLLSLPIAEVTNSVIVSEDLAGLTIRRDIKEIYSVLSQWIAVRIRQAALQILGWIMAWGWV